MPRLIANEYVYSSGSALDDCYNDYITSPPTTQLQQHYIQQQQPQLTTAMESSALQPISTTKAKSRSQSPIEQEQPTSSCKVLDDNTKQSLNLAKQPTHTISSSEADEELAKEQVTIEDELVSFVSNDSCSDFKGFDNSELTTPNSSGLINDASQEDIHNYLKRRSHADFFDYREDSEGLVEAIEVDDDAPIAIGDDGQILYKLQQEVTPVKSKTQRYESNPHTPNKRKKQGNETFFSAISPTNLKTPPDQIVEINSDSTTHSQKQKRQQINTKFQLNLSQQQQQLNHKLNNTANKCSTESTSEFPVSSPSNPQQPRGGGKYPPRPPLLKNTLPADSFERQLAMITACNPQMTLAEKIQGWVCEDEFSDVEDVNVFDKEFKRVEEQRKAELRQKNKSGRGGGGGGNAKQASGNTRQYDFFKFRQMIINNMKDKKNQKFFGGGQGGSGGNLQSGRCLETSGSESSQGVKHIDHERPTTSAVAQQQLMQQRRIKPQVNLELGEIKKRMIKENPKRNQNSTTPPQTSSSDNEQDCFQNHKKHTGHDKLQHHHYNHTRQIQIHDKLLCPSSSEEANSQDMPTTPVQMKSKQSLVEKGTLNNLRNKSPTRPPPTPPEGLKQNENKTISKNVAQTEEDIDLVFRLHRLNREIDKQAPETRTPPKTAEEQSDETPRCLIQMRLDFANENKTKKLSLEKKQELFKTPIIPQKYLPPTASPNTNQTQETQTQTPPSISATKPLLSEQSIKSLLQPTSSAPTTPEKEVGKDSQENVKDNDRDLEGVYHQQHEFCNYLGLTGMSTATAMANAVAELAQCNLARRSMRVLRQQQQERKDKSAKEEKELQAQKTKEKKELRKRERSGCDVATVDVEENLHKSDEGCSHSQTSEPTASTTPSFKGIKKRTKSSTNSQTSLTIVKKEPDIKLHCHVAAKNKEEAEKLSKEYIKKITQPIRETLMRHVKQRKQEQAEDENEEEDQEDKAKDEKEMDKNEEKENDVVGQKKEEDKIEIKHQIQKETKTDKKQADEVVEELLFTAKKEDVELCRRSLRSPRLSAMPSKSQVKVTKSPTSDAPEEKIKQLEDKEAEQVVNVPVDTFTKEVHITETNKIEAVEDVPSVTNTKEVVSNKSPLLEIVTNTEELKQDKPECDSIVLIETGAGTPRSTATPIMLQHKIQKALEESRKSKPSIFIVQSLESPKEPLTKLQTCDSVINTKDSPPKPIPTSPLTSPVKISNVTNKQIQNPYKELKSLKVTTKFNKKDLKNVFKTRRGGKKRRIAKNLNTSAPKRQLRKRKIIVIKTTKPREKLFEKTKVFQRELRSSPKPPFNASLLSDKVEEFSLRKPVHHHIQASKSEAKSYRTVHTETKDLETYLDTSKGPTKTRLMSKTSGLMERSKSLGLRGGKLTNKKPKLNNKIKGSKLSLRARRQKILKSNLANAKDKRKYKTSSSSSLSSSAVPLTTSATTTRENIVTKTESEVQTNITALNLLDNENVVVSSTTNNYDERPFPQHPHHQEVLVLQSSPNSQRPLHNNSSTVVETKEQFTQSNVMSSAGGTIRYLNTPPSPTELMHNPLKSEDGIVLNIYYELDILIVIQERLVSFWKCSKLLNILSTIPLTQTPPTKINTGHHHPNTASSISPKQNLSDIWNQSHNLASSSGGQVRQPACSSTLWEPTNCGEWMQLGELTRLDYDFEISVPYANRICHHNSIPIYLEMRARQLPKNHRDCNLLSLYLNIYYYHDEDMIAKCNSIQLDTIQSDIKSVNYTTLMDSRYFIMTWPQENLLGKTRSGICKYSLTPQLDTLASIREFKSMRHTIRYLECMSDDKLIGFGETQVTIWDHRSGDVLMHYDLEIPMGKNFGSVYFSSQDIEQNNMLILYQYRDFKNDNPPELMILACTLTHTQPSYRVLQQLTLPTPSFKNIKSAINTGDHIILNGQNNEEIWISTTNPSLVTLMSSNRDSKRFYSRERSQLIELTEKTLNIDTLSNHILQLAAGFALRK